MLTLMQENEEVTEPDATNLTANAKIHIISISKRHTGGGFHSKHMGYRRYRTNKTQWAVYLIAENGKFVVKRIRWYQVLYYKALYIYQSIMDR